jgi:hypothetical protein
MRPAGSLVVQPGSEPFATRAQFPDSLGSSNDPLTIRLVAVAWVAPHKTKTKTDPNKMPNRFKNPS